MKEGSFKMEVIFQNQAGLEEIILYHRTFGDVDFRFIRKGSNGEELLNNRIELSGSNANAQKEIDEMFHVYKIAEELKFNITDALIGVPNLKRRQ